MCAWILLLVGLFISPALVASFASDLVHTSVYLGASHLDRSTMCGRFDKVDGAINFDEAIYQGGSDFIADADSINTHLRMLGGVLRSEQFLDVTRFLIIRLRGDRFVVEGDKLIAIEVNLMLHGVTQPVRSEVRRFSCGDEKISGNTRHVCGSNFHPVIARGASGMTRFLPDVSNRVDLDIDVEATPQ